VSTKSFDHAVTPPTATLGSLQPADRGGDDLIAEDVDRPVRRGVGALAVDREGHDRDGLVRADLDGRGLRQPTGRDRLVVERLDRGPDLGRGHVLRLDDRGVGVRQQQGELVAADPGGDVGLAQDRAHAARHGGERRVTGCVAVAVVDLLEAVEVDDDQRERLARPRHARASRR